MCAHRGSDERAMVLARWGGLGGHRYQVGFSGDVKDVNWDTLRYQPYFSTTAANVMANTTHIKIPGSDPVMAHAEDSALPRYAGRPSWTKVYNMLHRRV